MRKLLSATLLLLFLFTLASCGYDEEDIPVFYIKNGTEAYDPAQEIIDNFYSTFYDESESDEPQEATEPETTAKTADTKENDVPGETEGVTIDTSENSTETTGIADSSSTDDKDINITVYWVKSGEVWHLTDKCSSLSRSKNILSGSIEDAIGAGKARACKRCGG